jgi:serine/threonine protein kinase
MANGSLLALFSKQKIVHKDLAARNVLLSESNVAKVAGNVGASWLTDHLYSDFGLSRFLTDQDESHYSKSTVG